MPTLSDQTRPKIAAVVTEYRLFSHAQHICDRFLEGYGWNSHHHQPPMDLVSLYVDQMPEGDLSRERENRFDHLTIFPTVADALTSGTNDLAVDGVLLIGEHGSYGTNEKGQHLYPRYELFKEIVAVYRMTGATAPIFNDKHLSWNWDWAKEMYDTSVSMGFPFMSGSSLPVTWRTPALDLPLDAQVEEALCIAYGGVDSYDFHALETLQCMVERRKGGELGVRWLEAFRGDRFWEAYNDQLWSRSLFEAALCRSHTLTPARSGFNNSFPNIDEMQKLVEDPIAYHYEHLDGLRSTMILFNGQVQDFNFAARLRGVNNPFSTQMYLPMPPARTTLANFFSPLCYQVEQMFLNGEPSYPVERTLLTTGLVAAGVDSLHQDQAKIDTPHLGIAYQATNESTFWGAPGSEPGLPSLSSTQDDYPLHSQIIHDHNNSSDSPIRIAIIATVYTYLTHGQHFGDRFMVGYAYEGKWHHPKARVVSMYVDQRPVGDQSDARAREFGFCVYPTIAQALKCGGEQLAVDAVVIIGEHGDYPDNDLGQKQYPRYEFFKQCVEVFEENGSAVPIYNDKHLSYSFQKADEMVADSHRLGFPLLSGSSLPVTWRLPDVELPKNCDLEEAVMIGTGGDGSDAMDYHALEAMQCMIERRKGGETGITAVQHLEGDDVWKAGDSNRWSWKLLEAALSRSDTPCGNTIEDGRTQNMIENGELKRLVKKPEAYLIEFRDGLRASLLLINGAIRDYCFATKMHGTEDPISTQIFLTPTPPVTYSASLVAKIFETMITGTAAFPAERTLTVNGIQEACLKSKAQNHKRIETPHLTTTYQSPSPSHHARR